MKYIQTYKNKLITNQGLQIETWNDKIIFLTKTEMDIYNYFSTATDIKDVFTTLYGDPFTNNQYTDIFNSLLVDWIQLSILKIA